MKIGIHDGGYAVFSLENVSGESEARLDMIVPQWRWQLTPSGRVAHRKEYVEDVAKANSFEIIIYEKLDNFRKEKGHGVRGHLFILRKKALGKDEL
jgi:predicted TPR repeat methyltransferase